MKFIKKHLSTILISLIIGVLLFYIQPILDYFGNKVVEFFIFTSETFRAAYYKSIATNNPYVFDDFNSYILTFGMIIFFLYVFKELKGQRNNLKTKVKSSIEKIKFLKEEIQNNDEQIENDKESLLKKLNELESSSEKIKLALEKRSNLLLSLIIIISFISVLLFSNYALNKSITDENISFRNKTIILLPFVGNEKINHIKSDWAQMKNSHDYETLMKRVELLEKTYLLK